ncbi:MAG: HK97 family phage prohead protease [Planctomycetes bacterium]|nr:HK97 family phage prohead protease [Planctomycetota bacterium]
MENATRTLTEAHAGRPKDWDEVFRSLDYDREPERGRPLLRGLCFEVREVPGKPRTLRFTGSDETEDRHGDVISVDGWDLAHFQRNPVFLWTHDYLAPPVGKAVGVQVRDGKLEFDIEFADRDTFEFADTVFRLYKGGFLRATSVGFMPHEWVTEDLDEDGNAVGAEVTKPAVRKRRRYTKQELLELSAVPVPANPNATIQESLNRAVKRGVITAREAVHFERQAAEPKMAIPFKHYPLDPEDAEWDGPAEIAGAEVDDLRLIAAWFDAGAPDVKTSYKLPHHRAGNKNTVWNGVRAAMGALLGARGGVDIPDADRRGVYDHLASHYEEFEKEPPEFRQYSEEEMAKLADDGLITNPYEERKDPRSGGNAKHLEPLLQEVAGQLVAIAERIRAALEDEEPGDMPEGQAGGDGASLRSVAEDVRGLRTEIQALAAQLNVLRGTVALGPSAVPDDGLYGQLLGMGREIRGALGVAPVMAGAAGASAMGAIREEG